MNLNGLIIKQLPAELEQAQRALFYSDGLFETIRASADGTVPHLAQHVERLLAGLQLLEFAVPPHWNTTFFAHEIARILPTATATATAHRIRLTVWRSPGGLYLPTQHTPQFLITAPPLTSAGFAWPVAGIRVGICQSVRLPVDTFSNLKTLNAPRYVAAAREARRSGWDDALLLNHHDRVCEATSSNVFWQTADGTWHTPPLSEGCVAGTVRARVIEKAHLAGILVQERPISPDQLFDEAVAIFLTNAIRGVVPVVAFDRASSFNLPTTLNLPGLSDLEGLVRAIE